MNMKTDFAIAKRAGELYSEDRVAMRARAWHEVDAGIFNRYMNRARVEFGKQPPEAQMRPVSVQEAELIASRYAGSVWNSVHNQKEHTQRLAGIINDVLSLSPPPAAEPPQKEPSPERMAELLVLERAEAWHEANGQGLSPAHSPAERQKADVALMNAIDAYRETAAEERGTLPSLVKPAPQATEDTPVWHLEHSEMRARMDDFEALLQTTRRDIVLPLRHRIDVLEMREDLTRADRALLHALTTTVARMTTPELARFLDGPFHKAFPGPGDTAFTEDLEPGAPPISQQPQDYEEEIRPPHIDTAPIAVRQAVENLDQLVRRNRKAVTSSSQSEWPKDLRDVPSHIEQLARGLADLMVRCSNDRRRLGALEPVVESLRRRS